LSESFITQGKVKQKNLADTLLFILEKQQTTRREIEYETGFSWGTVSNNIALLLEKGYIYEEKSEKSGSAGRTTYIIKPNGEYIAGIGLDINRSGLSCEIVGLDLKVKHKLEAEFTASTQKEVIEQSEKLCKEALSFCTDNKIRPISLGIAIQGAVDGKTGISMKLPDVEDWKPFNVKTHFSQKYGLPVYIGHDPKCMLLGEHSKNKYNNCVLVRADEGIGMAVALDGRILDDTERFELGHITAVEGGKKCRCGRRGCLEAYASLRAIGGTRDTKDIFEYPARYCEATRNAGRHLCAALRNIHTLFKPQRIILTGSAAKLSAYTESTEKELSALGVEVTVDPYVSAAYGAAAESIKSAIKNYHI